VTGVQPELWVDRPSEAITFYQAAFGATVVHQAGEGEDIVAQLAVGDAYFWVANTDPGQGRFSAVAIGDPDTMVSAARAAGATVTSSASDEHGWRLGRITDPFGHHWEIGTPIGPWPP